MACGSHGFTEDGCGCERHGEIRRQDGQTIIYPRWSSVAHPDDDDENVGLDFDYFLDHTLEQSAVATTPRAITSTIRRRKFFIDGISPSAAESTSATMAMDSVQLEGGASDQST
jgi:hypothetical protein